MSTQGLQQVVCRAVVDREFMDLLARAPAEAIAGFELDADERELLLALRPRTLKDLAAGVESWRRGRIATIRVLAPAGVQDAMLARRTA